MIAATPAVRAYRSADFDALHALIAAAAAPGIGMTRTGLEEHLEVPGVMPARDLFLVDLPGTAGVLARRLGRPGHTDAGAVEDGGRGRPRSQVGAQGQPPVLLGARDVRVAARGDEAVPIIESWGVLHPDARGTEIPRVLLRAALARAGGLVAERGRARGVFQVRFGDQDAVARALCESVGLRVARRLHTLFLPTLDDLRPVRLPAGIELRPYQSGIEAAWVKAFNDAFADHWGGFMGMPLAFWEQYVRRPWFQPAISLVAWAGDQIAGFGHFRIDDEANRLAGRQWAVMRYIGVRPPWRGLGLGVALTRAGLHAVRAAGMTAVASGVDSENVTGAHQIYEREGFVVTRSQLMYRTDIIAAAAAPVQGTGA